MSVPFLTIADALAAKFVPAQVTPPTGYRNITFATARLNNNIVNVPFVAVFPPAPGEIEVTYVNQNQRTTVIPFKLRFYFEKSSGDLAEVTTALYSWATVLYDRLNTGNVLGLGGNPGVMKTFVTSGPGFASLPYAGTEYDGIEWTVSVWYKDDPALTP
jgi:hypothetical protein